MKVCICSSFKFYREVLDLAEKLAEEGFEALVYPVGPFRYPKTGKIFREPTQDEAKAVTVEHLNNIDKSGLVYILSKDGYVGRSVSIEIGYAFKADKIIYSSEIIQDHGPRSLVDEVIPKEELIKKLNSKKK